MPRNKEQNAAIRDKRRTKILEKSLKLFAINGFDEVSVDDIMDAANCSHGLFYHYFTSKEDVYNALLVWKNEKYPDSVLPREEAVQAGGIKGLRLLADYCERVVSAPDEVCYFARLSAMRHYAANAYNDAVLGEDPYPYLIQLINQGQAEGSVRPGDPEEIASMFVDFANGAMYSRITLGNDKYCLVHSESIMRIFEK
jgi:AcrR family transcriptional regulator